MRRNNAIYLILIITTVCLLVSSCAKKEAPATIYTKVIGKWKWAQYATDDNRNGVIDANEIAPVASDIDDEISFKNDGTGVETRTVNKEPQIPLSFTWQLFYTDSIRLQYKANDTETYYIFAISSVDLTLTTTKNQGLAWYYYRKI